MDGRKGNPNPLLGGGTSRRIVNEEQALRDVVGVAIGGILDGHGAEAEALEGDFVLAQNDHLWFVMQVDMPET